MWTQFKLSLFRNLILTTSVYVIISQLFYFILRCMGNCGLYLPSAKYRFKYCLIRVRRDGGDTGITERTFNYH